MNENSSQFAKSVNRENKVWAEACVKEMIKVANLIPIYEEPELAIPDYETVLQTKYLERDKSQFDPLNKDEEYLSIVSEVWNEIERKYTDLAAYATTQFDNVIGKEILDKIPEKDSVIFEDNSIKQIYYRISPEIIKIQNFIRLRKIAHNIRWIAILLYATKLNSKKGFPLPKFKVSGQQLGWKDIHYEFPKIRNHRFKIPFDLKFPLRSNKEVGTLTFSPSFMERVFNKIDILQIKICFRCSKLFFAEPRNTDYCKKTCKYIEKSQRYHKRKETLSSIEN